MKARAAVDQHGVQSNAPLGSYRGYIYIGAAAAFWGISASLGRAAFTGRLLPRGSGIDRVSPLVLSQARTSFAFLVFLIGLLATRGWKKLLLPRRDLAAVTLLGLAGVAVSNYFYYLAIQHTNVATAIIIQYTAPVWVLLYMVVRGFERATWAKIWAVILAVFGIALVIGVFRSGKMQLDALGVLAALIASFSFTYYNIAGHTILLKHDRWIVLLYTTLAASLFWIILNPPAKIIAANFSPAVWLFLFGFAVCSVLVPFIFYFAGLQHLKPTNAIIASCLEPVFTILIAAVALKETVGALQTVGIAMVLSAIIVVRRPGRGADLEPSAGPVD